jgi:site-specific recombinase XerC
MQAADSNTLESLRWRDKALLSLMIGIGVRAVEACLLTRDAVLISPKESYIRVEGKGRKKREIGFGRQ